MPAKKKLTAKVEPFDTFWEAPEDIEKGYTSFYQFYRRITSHISRSTKMPASSW